MRPGDRGRRARPSRRHDVNKERVAGTTEAFYAYVADDNGAFRLVFESDLTSEPAVRERVDRVTRECAEAIAEVISEDTGFPAETARLLAVALVGMSQVSARYWLSADGELPRENAVELISSLAWRGIRGFPRHERSGRVRLGRLATLRRTEVH